LAKKDLLKQEELIIRKLLLTVAKPWITYGGSALRNNQYPEALSEAIQDYMDLQVHERRYRELWMKQHSLTENKTLTYVSGNSPP